MLTTALLSLALTPWVPADPPRLEPISSAVIDEHGPFETHLAANGGWKVAAWRDYDFVLHAEVTRPDGTVLARALDRDETAQQPAVGIDARGNAFVAWANGDHVRTARGPRLARGPAFSDGDTVDVAVSPGGRTLLSWSGRHGVFAQLDGGAPQQVGDGGASELQSAINDAGAAVLASHSFTPDGVWLLDRAPDGPWTAERDVSGDHQIPFPADDNDPTARWLSTAISADGRAVLAWGSPRGKTAQVYGVAGRAGDHWDAVQRLSSPVLDGYGADAGLDAAGDPVVTWQEEARPRGAKPVAGAVPDTTPLTVAARLVERLAPVRTGNVHVSARVRCSKACSARLQWAGLWNGPWYGEPVELPPGVTKAVRLTAGDERFLSPRHSGRLRVTLVVTDRAGNVFRQPRTYRLKVVRPPLRSFRVGPSHSFEMFTRAGDRAVGRLVNALLDGLADNTIKSERALRARWLAGAAALERAGYEEIHDTEVGDAIYVVVRRPFALAGYSAEAVLSG
ncbi:hypothetical protein C8N24_6230 [Solirubrobacter pauli]|uniref:Uncharacterized protein n=1 Tax=Solirubrobacter pauli TaxID=166793 RepID=A0A660L5M6_9ACTN|nr:hypothetical protein [Solirubrobacter pauli]RKQ88189.1 hypothetical protein C8N24_6230 [Solirubrobacter pauli]